MLICLCYQQHHQETEHDRYSEGPSTPCPSHKPNSRITITTNTLHISSTRSILCKQNHMVCTLSWMASCAHYMYMKFICIVAYDCTFLLFLLYFFYFITWKILQFIHFTVGGLLGCFQFLALKNWKNFQVSKELLYVLSMDYQECLVDPLGLFDSIDICTFVLTGLFCNTISNGKPIATLLTLVHRNANEFCLEEIQLNCTL